MRENASGLLELFHEPAVIIDREGRVRSCNVRALDLLGYQVGDVLRLWSEPTERGAGRTRIARKNGGAIPREVAIRALESDEIFVTLREQQHEFALALQHMTDALLTERDSLRVLEALARITGETLGVDRSLIYEIREPTQELVALCEWLNPGVEVTATKATYPLGVFGAGNVEIKRTRTWLESHADHRHAALASDGSAGILHDQMSIQSLLWFPFDFREYGYFSLVFNQVSHLRAWLPDELEFLRVAIRHVQLALLQISMHDERAEAERVLLEAQKAESISVLAAGVAHDFNGHLGIVLGLVGRTRAALGEASVHAPFLRDAERAAREAAELAKHLLSYAGGGQFVIALIDLIELAKEMQDLLQAAAGHVVIRFALKGPAFVRADAGQLRQVLMNLVVNAAEAVAGADRAEIHLLVAPDHSNAEAPRVLLEVRDTGCGMTPEVQRRVFEPFFSTKNLGRGLGLAAVGGIVRAHSAEMRVESTPGVGSTFSVLFPAVAATPMAPARAPVTRHSHVQTILVVDDSNNFRHMCCSLLDDLGYRAIDASDGIKAATILETNGVEIDAAMIDWTMPPPSGEETFRRLRAIRPQLPILIMSGYAASGATELVLQGGAEFVEKPFTVDTLEAALAELLGSSLPNRAGALATDTR